MKLYSWYVSDLFSSSKGKKGKLKEKLFCIFYSISKCFVLWDFWNMSKREKIEIIFDCFTLWCTWGVNGEVNVLTWNSKRKYSTSDNNKTLFSKEFWNIKINNSHPSFAIYSIITFEIKSAIPDLTKIYFK